MPGIPETHRQLSFYFFPPSDVTLLSFGADEEKVVHFLDDLICCLGQKFSSSRSLSRTLSLSSSTTEIAC